MTFLTWWLLTSWLLPAPKWADDNVPATSNESTDGEFAVQELAGPGQFSSVMSVNIKSPDDSVINSAKLSKHESGAVIPSSCETLLATSPDLHHKGAGMSGHHTQEPIKSGSSGSVGKVFPESQWGSSISPENKSISMEEDLNIF